MEACLEVDFGGFKFHAEGSSAWVDEKYDVFVSQMKSMSIDPAKPKNSSGNKGTDSDVQDVGPLALFLKAKNVGSNQNDRFLATAIWLKLQGQTIIKTAGVTKALAEAQQQRLGNPADVLNKNVKKGYCVKNGDGFYVTPEGVSHLGNA